MKVRTLIALPFYVVWLIIFMLSLLLGAIAAIIDGDEELIMKAYTKSAPKSSQKKEKE